METGLSRHKHHQWLCSYCSFQGSSNIRHDVLRHLLRRDRRLFPHVPEGLKDTGAVQTGPECRTGHASSRTGQSNREGNYNKGSGQAVQINTVDGHQSWRVSYPGKDFDTCIPGLCFEEYCEHVDGF